MKRLAAVAIAITVATLALLVGLEMSRSAGGDVPNVWSTATLLRMAAPGPLSSAHAFLADRCDACHTPVRGVEAYNCIACHADDAPLLQRQPTAFHAEIDRCAECHVEHQGYDRRPTKMEHVALAKIAQRMIHDAHGVSPAPAGGEGVRRRIVQPAAPDPADESAPASDSVVNAEEAALRCDACHSNEDRHVGLFGPRCELCHATEMWTIARFRHPSPRSRDCAQCHQAPPSHYMEHFSMVSMRIARRSRANVEQCYLCHQTTAWNDILGVGRYKHH